jgi:hypothetical protein
MLFGQLIESPYERTGPLANCQIVNLAAGANILRSGPPDGLRVGPYEPRGVKAACAGVQTATAAHASMTIQISQRKISSNGSAARL